MTGFLIYLLKDIKKILFLIGHPFFIFLVFILQIVINLNLLFKDFKSEYDYQTLKLSKLTKKVLFTKITFRPKVTWKLSIPKIQIYYKPVVKLNIKKWILISGSLFLLLITMLTIGIYSLLYDLPSAEELKTRQPAISTKIYDRDDNLMYTIYKDENRTPVALDEIPIYVRLATVAVEDAEFYNHNGFSPRGMTRAIVSYLQTGVLTGGSTITQQLVKNTLLTPERTFTRKARELYLAVQVERTFSKDEILEMYLNEVSYGGPAYGIETAAKYYFDKKTNELTLGEAAMLAGLTKSPTIYSPFGSHQEYSFGRRDEVLNLMVQNDFITLEAAEEAKSQPITFADNKTNIDAPHFVMYVREQLVNMFGEDLVERGGLTVKTTLDSELQEFSEEVINNEIEKLTRLNVSNGAAVVASPRTGEILAMVGSRNYFDISNDGNVNVALQLRQPGSSIKVVNYAYALSHGFTPASIIDDSPITFDIPGSLPYKPKNYDDKYRGKITLRSALAESRNIPAVKILNTYGVNNMINLGEQMGITTWSDRSRFGLSLTLGGGEVRLIDLAQVYATLANKGIRENLSPFIEVTDSKGKVLYKNKEDGQQVLDPRVAFMITDILSDNDARTPAFGRFSALNISNHPEVAVKTGTSNSLRDNLTVGYTQDYVVAVWVGNNDNTPMSRVASGVTGASPVWNKIMTGLLSETNNVAGWQAPENLVQVPICKYTGTLPCSGCPVTEEWFIPGTEPTFHCSPQSPDQQLANNPEANNVH